MCYRCAPSGHLNEPRHCAECGKPLSFTPEYGQAKFDIYTGQPIANRRGVYQCPDYSEDYRAFGNGHTRIVWPKSLGLTHR